MYFKVSTHVIMTLIVIAILTIFFSKFCSTFKGYESKADIFVLNKPSSFFVNSRDNIGILPDEKILLLKPGSLWEMM